MTVVDEHGEICDEVQKKLEHDEVTDELIDAARAARGLLLMLVDCDGTVIDSSHTALFNMAALNLDRALDRFYEVI